MLVLKCTSNAIVLAFFSFLTLASYHHVQTTGSMRSVGVLLVNALFVGLYLTRREAKAVSPVPLAWCLAFAGTLFPMMMRPGGEAFPVVVLAGDVLQAAGLVLIAVAMLSLRRSFGIVAANRGVMIGGLYRFVRHPLYAGELIAFLGYVLANPSGWNVVLLITQLGLQTGRARIEEGFLASDPVYRQYRRRVRRRFIPGVI